MSDRNFGSFVPTTNIWDTTELEDTKVTSPAFKELLVRLYQNLSLMSTVLNTKISGYYDTQEFVTGELYFPKPGTTSLTNNPTPDFRPVKRKVINFGALPNAGTKNVPHGITVGNNTIFVGCTAYATDPVNHVSFELPYSSPTLIDNIEIYTRKIATVPNITVVTGSDRTAFTICYVVLEWIERPLSLFL